MSHRKGGFYARLLLRVAVFFAFAQLACAESAGAYGPLPPGEYVFVANEGSSTVSAIDTSSRQIIGSIPTGIGADPRELVVTEDDSHAYVLSQNHLFVVDLVTREIVESIPVGGRPGGVAVSKDGKRVYVTGDPSAVIDTAFPASAEPLPLSAPLAPVALTPDGATAYIGGTGITIIDTSTLAVVDTLDSPRTTIDIAATPTGGLIIALSPQRMLVIDPVSNHEIVAEIDLRIPDRDDSARSLVVSPDGKTAFVSHPFADRVSVVDLETFARVAVSQTCSRPERLALSADGRFLYTSHFVEPGIGGVCVIDRADFSVVAKTVGPGAVHDLVVGHRGEALFYTASEGSLYELRLDGALRLSAITASYDPFGIAVSADESTGYVTHPRSGTVSLVDLVAGRVTATIPTGANPAYIAATPDGNRVYATEVAFFPTVTSSVFEIDPINREVVRRIPVGGGAKNIVIDGDGQYAYIAGHFIGSLEIVDLDAGMTIDRVEIGGETDGLALSPEGDVVYIANSLRRKVTLVSTDSREVLQEIDIEMSGEPCAIALTPDGRKAYVSGATYPLGRAESNATVIDAETLQVSSSISLADFIFTGVVACGSVATRNGDSVYVTDASNGLAHVIDTDTDREALAIATGIGPAGIALACVGCDEGETIAGKDSGERRLSRNSKTRGSGSLVLSSPAARPGSTVNILFSLAASDDTINSIRQRFMFPVDLFESDLRACRREWSFPHAMHKTLLVRAVLSDNSQGEGTIEASIRPVGIGRDGTRTLALNEPLPDGPLYSCTLRVRPSATEGLYPLDSFAEAASHPDAEPSDPLVVQRSFLEVSDAGGGCVADCGRDGEVTVNDVILAVNIALGFDRVESCPLADRDDSGDVTVDELLAAVTSALHNCDMLGIP